MSKTQYTLQCVCTRFNSLQKLIKKANIQFFMSFLVWTTNPLASSVTMSDLFNFTWVSVFWLHVHLPPIYRYICVPSLIDNRKG